MKSSGKLVRKEQSKGNFKLVFNRDKRTFFVFLHKEEKKIFNHLRIGIDYSFLTWKKKGYKYFSVKPQSIKEFRQVSFKPVRQINTRNLFISNLGKSLQLSNMNEEAIKIKLANLRNKRQSANTWEDREFLNHVREVIFTLFLNRELSSLIQPNDNSTEQFLQDLENIFLTGKLLG